MTHNFQYRVIEGHSDDTQTLYEVHEYYSDGCHRFIAEFDHFDKDKADLLCRVLSQPTSENDGMRLPECPEGYRLSVERTAHGIDNRTWMARLITNEQMKDCVKGYGPTPYAASMNAIKVLEQVSE